MAPVVTLQGIDEAISNLGYRNREGTKSRLVQAIRAHYERDDSILSLKSIDSDTLIKMLWAKALDPVTIRNRRRNLSSIKSSVNSDLKRLYREGENPEGITISSSNTFVMSDEAKDSALEALRGISNREGGDRLDQLAGALNTLKEVLSSSGNLGELPKDEAPAALHELRDLIRGLSEKIGIAGTEPSGTGEKDPGSFGAELSVGRETTEPQEEGGTGGAVSFPGELEKIEEAPAVDRVEVDDTDVLESLEEADPEETFEEIDGEELGDEEVELLDESETLDEEDLEEASEEEGLDIVEAEEAFEAGDVIEITPDESLEDVEETEEELEEVEETVFDDEDLEAIDPEPADEILEAFDEEEAAIDEDEIEEADDADVLEPLEEAEFEETEFDEEVLGIEPSDELEEVEEAPAVETEEVESLEEAEPEEPFEEYDAMIGSLGDQGTERGWRGLESDGVSHTDGLEITSGVGGYAESLEYADDFREEGLLAHAEESGRLLKDFGEENLDGEPGPSQNTDRSRVLAEQFNRSLAAMDRFFNQYVLVPGGRYPTGKKRPAKGERARRIIELSSFYMGKFPVTNALFEVFIEKTGYKTTAERVGYGTVYDGRVQRAVDEETGLETYTWSSSLTNKIVKGACWYQPLGPGSTLHKKRNHPVVQISLEDALAFAAWTGKGVPTEEEWEAASRTANGHSLPWGRRWEKDACNFEDSSIGDTTPVDRFMAWENDLGVADSLGNVWEWTSTPFENGAESKGRSYVAKGGSWVTSKPLNLATRIRVDTASHSNILGFRCLAY